MLSIHSTPNVRIAELVSVVSVSSCCVRCVRSAQATLRFLGGTLLSSHSEVSAAVFQFKQGQSWSGGALSFCSQSLTVENPLHSSAPPESSPIADRAAPQPHWQPPLIFYMPARQAC